MSQDKKLGTIIMLTGMSVLFALIWVAGLFAKELPRLVPLEEVGKQYDTQRISVFGWVRSVEIKPGRMGSHYVELTLGEGDKTVKIITLNPVYNLLDRHVIVQGTYKAFGHIGGIPLENYISAEYIERDWQEAPASSHSPDASF